MTTKMKMKMRTTTMMTRKIMMMTLTRIKNWWKWWWGQRWQWQRKGRWLTAGKSFSADTDNPGCDCYPLLRLESRERKQKGWSWSYCHQLWNWQVCILHTFLAIPKYNRLNSLRGHLSLTLKRIFRIVEDPNGQYCDYPMSIMIAMMQVAKLVWTMEAAIWYWEGGSVGPNPRWVERRCKRQHEARPAPPCAYCLPHHHHQHLNHHQHCHQHWHHPILP